MSSVVNIPTSATGYHQSIVSQAAAAQKVVNRMQLSPTLNSKGFVQPLGKITNSASEFQKSMDASAARVFAFGAAVGVINGISDAFQGLIQSAAEVEKSLKDVQVVMEATDAQMQKFGKGIFDVAQNTATSFATVAESAIELARQGLSTEETLARVNSALILSRLSGLDAVKSTETLTAAINSFNKEGVSHEQIVNRMANVDAAFAVSSADLAEAISRAGAVAQSAGVSFNELSAIVTAVQQRTARGGSVIGNGFKSIFTRIKRSGVREALEEIGVATKNVDGSFRSSIDILKDYAQVYTTLSDAQKAYTSEQIAGVFQIQNLQALIQDLGSGFSVYEQALSVANNTTDEATRRNEELNQTLSAIFSQTSTGVKEFAARLGELALTDSFKEILQSIGSLAEFLNDVLDEEKGSDFAKNFIKGFGSFLTGPGLVIVGAAFIKIFSLVTKFATEAFSDLLGLNNETKRQQGLQTAINSILTNNSQVYSKILLAGQNTAKQEQIILNIIRQETAERIKQEALLKRIASSSALAGIGASEVGFVPMGKNKRKGKKSLNLSEGFLPAIHQENKDISRGVGGARKGDKPVVLKNHKMGGGRSENIVAHTGEWVVRNFKGSGGDAIFNREMVNNFGLPKGAKKITASGGLVPNFAKSKKSKLSKASLELGWRGGGRSEISKKTDFFDKFTATVNRFEQDKTAEDARRIAKKESDKILQPYWVDKKGKKIESVWNDSSSKWSGKEFKRIEKLPSDQKVDFIKKYKINRINYRQFYNKGYGDLIKSFPYNSSKKYIKDIINQKGYSGPQPKKISEKFANLNTNLSGATGELGGAKFLKKQGYKNVKFIPSGKSFDFSAKDKKGQTLLFEGKQKDVQNVSAYLKKGATQYLKNVPEPAYKDNKPQEINLDIVKSSGKTLFPGGINAVIAKNSKETDSIITHKKIVEDPKLKKDLQQELRLIWKNPDRKVSSKNKDALENLLFHNPSSKIPRYSTGFVPNFQSSSKGVMTEHGFFNTRKIALLKRDQFAYGSKSSDNKEKFSEKKIFLNTFSVDDRKKINNFEADFSKGKMKQANDEFRQKKSSMSTIDASRQATMLVPTNNFRRKVDSTYKTDKGNVRLRYRVEGIKSKSLKNTEEKVRERVKESMINQSSILAREISSDKKFSNFTPIIKRISNAGSVGSAAGSIFETALKAVGSNKLFTNNNAGFDIVGFPSSNLQNLFGYYTPFADAKISLNKDTKRDFNQKLLKLPSVVENLTQEQSLKQQKVSADTRKKYGPVRKASSGYIPSFTIKRSGFGGSSSVFEKSKGKERTLHVSHIRAQDDEFGSTIYNKILQEIISAAKSGRPYTKIDAGSIIGPRIPRALLSAKKALDRKRLSTEIPKMNIEGVFVPRQLRKRVEGFRQENFYKEDGKFKTKDKAEYLPKEESKLIKSLRQFGLGRNAQKQKKFVRLEDFWKGKSFSKGLVPNFSFGRNPLRRISTKMPTKAIEDPKGKILFKGKKYREAKFNTPDWDSPNSQWVQPVMQRIQGSKKDLEEFSTYLSTRKDIPPYVASTFKKALEKEKLSLEEHKKRHYELGKKIKMGNAGHYERKNYFNTPLPEDNPFRVELKYLKKDKIDDIVSGFKKNFASGYIPNFADLTLYRGQKRPILDKPEIGKNMPSFSKAKSPEDVVSIIQRFVKSHSTGPLSGYRNIGEVDGVAPSGATSFSTSRKTAENFANSITLGRQVEPGKVFEKKVPEKNIFNKKKLLKILYQKSNKEKNIYPRVEEFKKSIASGKIEKWAKKNGGLFLNIAGEHNDKRYLALSKMDAGRMRSKYGKDMHSIVPEIDVGRTSSGKRDIFRKEKEVMQIFSKGFIPNFAKRAKITNKMANYLYDNGFASSIEEAKLFSRKQYREAVEIVNTSRKINKNENLEKWRISPEDSNSKARGPYLMPGKGVMNVELLDKEIKWLVKNGFVRNDQLGQLTSRKEYEAIFKEWSMGKRNNNIDSKIQKVEEIINDKKSNPLPQKDIENLNNDQQSKIKSEIKKKSKLALGKYWTPTLTQDQMWASLSKKDQTFVEDKIQNLKRPSLVEAEKSSDRKIGDQAILPQEIKEEVSKDKTKSEKKSFKYSSDIEKLYNKIVRPTSNKRIQLEVNQVKEKIAKDTRKLNKFLVFGSEDRIFKENFNNKYDELNFKKGARSISLPSKTLRADKEWKRKELFNVQPSYFDKLSQNYDDPGTQKQLYKLNQNKYRLSLIEGKYDKDLGVSKAEYKKDRYSYLASAIDREVKTLMDIEKSKRNESFLFKERGVKFEKNIADFTKKSVKKARSIGKKFGKFLIPNYSNPLKEALGREITALKQRGLPTSSIKIEKSNVLKNSKNPLGLAVTNKFDEPAGVQQGITRAKKMGIDPKIHGKHDSIVPNFARIKLGKKKKNEEVSEVDPPSGRGMMGQQLGFGIGFAAPMIAEQVRKGMEEASLSFTQRAGGTALDYAGFGGLLGGLKGAGIGALAGLTKGTIDHFRRSDDFSQMRMLGEDFNRQQIIIEKETKKYKSLEKYAAAIKDLNVSIASGDLKGIQELEAFLVESLMDISDPKILKRLKDLGGGSDNLSEKLALLTNEMAKAEKNIENAKNAQRGGAAITKQIQRDDDLVGDTTDFFLGLLPSFTQAGNGGVGRQQNRVSRSEAKDLLFELSSLTEGAYKVDKDELTSKLFSQENPYVLDPATDYKERFKDYQEFENYTSQRVGVLAKQQELDKLLKDSQVMYDLFKKYSTKGERKADSVDVVKFSKTNFFQNLLQKGQDAQAESLIEKTFQIEISDDAELKKLNATDVMQDNFSSAEPVEQQMIAQFNETLAKMTISARNQLKALQETGKDGVSLVEELESIDDALKKALLAAREMEENINDFSVNFSRSESLRSKQFELNKNFLKARTDIFERSGYITSEDRQDKDAKLNLANIFENAQSNLRQGIVSRILEKSDSESNIDINKMLDERGMPLEKKRGGYIQRNTDEIAEDERPFVADYTNQLNEFVKTNIDGNVSLNEISGFLHSIGNDNKYTKDLQKSILKEVAYNAKETALAVQELKRQTSLQKIQNAVNKVKKLGSSMFSDEKIREIQVAVEQGGGSLGFTPGAKPSTASRPTRYSQGRGDIGTVGSGLDSMMGSSNIETGRSGLGSSLGSIRNSSYIHDKAKGVMSTRFLEDALGIDLTQETGYSKLQRDEIVGRSNLEKLRDVLPPEIFNKLKASFEESLERLRKEMKDNEVAYSNLGMDPEIAGSEVDKQILQSNIKQAEFAKSSLEVLRAQNLLLANNFGVNVPTIPNLPTGDNIAPSSSTGELVTGSGLLNGDAPISSQPKGSIQEHVEKAILALDNNSQKLEILDTSIQNNIQSNNNLVESFSINSENLSKLTESILNLEKYSEVLQEATASIVELPEQIEKIMSEIVFNHLVKGDVSVTINADDIKSIVGEAMWESFENMLGSAVMQQAIASAVQGFIEISPKQIR